jgi:cytoskeletal protein RodZ
VRFPCITNPNESSSEDTNNAGTTNEEDDSPENLIIPTTVSLSADANDTKQPSTQDKALNSEVQARETSPQDASEDSQGLREEVDSPDIIHATRINSVNSGSESEKDDLTPQDDLQIHSYLNLILVMCLMMASLLKPLMMKKK